MSQQQGGHPLSTEQQAEPKRRSSRSAREGGRRRRRARSSATPTVAEATQATAVAPPAEISRSDARRQAKTESQRNARTSGGVFSRVVASERTQGLRKFVRDVVSEIRKVIWPDRETTRNLTILVIALSIVLGILLGGIDYVLYEIFEAF